MSCTREHVPIERKNKAITHARNWFNNILQTKEIFPIFANIDYHWDKAGIFKFQNGYEAITVPLTEINQNPAYLGHRILYLFPFKNGKGYFQSIIEVIPDTTHLKKHSNTINLKQFDGLICSWDVESGFVKGLMFEAGTAIANVKLEVVNRINKGSLDFNKMAEKQILSLPVAYCTGYLPAANWNFFWSSLLSDLGYNVSGLLSVGGGNPCEYTGCNGPIEPIDYIDPTQLGYGPVNNDDNDNVAEVWDISNNQVNNPCIKGTLDAVISSDCKNTITDILHSTFGAGSDLNIHFQDYAFNDNGKDGNTIGTVWPSGRLDIQVSLNTETLPFASKEFTGATIYHEILHGYLRSAGIIGSTIHHNTMANEYATKLQNALLNAFPGLDPVDAKALAWGGLEGTAAYDSIRLNHPSEYNDLQSRNAQHRVRTKGTPCP